VRAVRATQKFVQRKYGRLVVKRWCELRLTDDTLVHLADGMYSFCVLLSFDFDGQPSAAELIEAVLAHPRYDDGFISPWTGPHGNVHGPYRLETLTVGGFQPCSTATAWANLMDWPAINLSPWVSRDLIVSQEIVAAWVSPLIVGADEIYRLSVPREGNEYGAGWVSGFAAGFHEFIAIDRSNAILTVIVATDD
jgi:hypothetical protein